MHFPAIHKYNRPESRAKNPWLLQKRTASLIALNPQTFTQHLRAKRTSFTPPFAFTAGKG
jgi:hypothetical protein